MDKADLHIHTKYSDGSKWPREIVQEAVHKALRAIAITDHDTVDGIDEAVDEGKKLGLEVISGVEIECQFDGKTIHVLGLDIDHKNVNLVSSLNELVRQRTKRNLYILDTLTKNGVKIKYSELEKFSETKIMGRRHIALLMKNKGYVSTLQEAFDVYLNEISNCVAKLRFEEAAEIIKGAGGKSIFAHPQSSKMKPAELFAFVKGLKQNGLDGMEAFCSRLKRAEQKTFSNIARNAELIVSGGTDYHGSYNRLFEVGDGLGNLWISYTLAEKIKNAK